MGGRLLHIPQILFPVVCSPDDGCGVGPAHALMAFALKSHDLSLCPPAEEMGGPNCPPRGQRCPHPGRWEGGWVAGGQCLLGRQKDPSQKPRAQRPIWSVSGQRNVWGGNERGFTISRTTAMFPEGSGAPGSVAARRLAGWSWIHPSSPPIASSESQTGCARKGSGWPARPPGSLTL